MTARTATKANPYNYEWSGLKGLRLVGISVHECPTCGTCSATIPQVDGLHLVLAQWLLQKPGRLEGKEIRFLRKSVEMPANNLAERLGVTPEHLSRVEGGRKEVSHQIDLLTRVLVALCQNNADFRDIVNGRKKPQMLRFSPSKEKWELQAA